MARRSPRRARDRAALDAGPWCWPPADSTAFEDTFAAEGARPVARPGQVVAVTVRGQTTTLWHLRLAHLVTGLSVPLGADARASWRAAGIALPRSLPVLWRNVHDATRELPDVVRLRTEMQAPGFEERDVLVDGPSFGLAFFLLLASSVLDCAVPGDVLATASIDAYGRLSGVDGLPQKMDGLSRLAPGVARVIVAAEQVGEASDAARGRLDVIGAAHAAEALDRVYGNRLSSLLVEAGDNPDRRAELTSSFFRLALVGRGAAVDWSPVARGADQALGTWTDLAPEPRYQLEFARAVAARHESNDGPLPLPAPAWLSSRPRVLRVQILSHLVQHAADTGTPDAGEVERLAAAELQHHPRDAFLPQLRLHGALCRLWALTGRVPAALRDNEQLTQVAADIFAPSDASFPLSEWLRLAGAQGDAASFQRACDMRDQLLTHGGFGEHGTPYVDLAWARGRLQLQPADPEALAVARRLCDDASVPAHVRWSAHRWAGGRHARALVEGQDLSELARRYAVLVRLDVALAEHAGVAARASVSALAALDPGPVGHLVGHGADAAEVARLYPY